MQGMEVGIGVRGGGGELGSKQLMLLFLSHQAYTPFSLVEAPRNIKERPK